MSWWRYGGLLFVLLVCARDGASDGVRYCNQTLFGRSFLEYVAEKNCGVDDNLLSLFGKDGPKSTAIQDNFACIGFIEAFNLAGDTPCEFEVLNSISSEDICSDQKTIAKLTEAMGTAKVLEDAHNAQVVASVIANATICPQVCSGSNVYMCRAFQKCAVAAVYAAAIAKATTATVPTTAPATNSFTLPSLVLGGHKEESQEGHEEQSDQSTGNETSPSVVQISKNVTTAEPSPTEAANDTSAEGNVGIVTVDKEGVAPTNKSQTHDPKLSYHFSLGNDQVTDPSNDTQSKDEQEPTKGSDADILGLFGGKNDNGTSEEQTPNGESNDDISTPEVNLPEVTKSNSSTNSNEGIDPSPPEKWDGSNIELKPVVETPKPNDDTASSSSNDTTKPENVYENYVPQDSYLNMDGGQDEIKTEDQDEIKNEDQDENRNEDQGGNENESQNENGNEAQGEDLVLPEDDDDDEDDGGMFGYWHIAAVMLLILFLGVVGYFASLNRKKLRESVSSYMSKRKRRNEYKPVSNMEAGYS